MREIPLQPENKIKPQLLNQKPDQLDFLQRKLQELNDKKKMFESDYSRLPLNVSRSLQYEKKKTYLESELNTVDKDISAVKRKINELKKIAF